MVAAAEAAARARRAVDGRLQLPPGARPGAGPRPDRRRPARRRSARCAAAYLQDWLADADAPMTWRLRKETAGSGALGDLGSHVVDQVQFLLGARRSPSVPAVTAARSSPSRARAPTGTEDGHRRRRRLGHRSARRGGAVASVEVTPDGARAARTACASRSTARRGRCAFDLERAQRAVVVRHRRPRAGFTPASWSPRPTTRTSAPGGRPGHILGWDHTFTHQAADFLTAIAAGTRAVAVVRRRPAVQRVLAAIEDSAARGRRARVDAHLDASRGGAPDGHAASRSSPASGPTCRSRRSPGSPPSWGYDGLEIAVLGRPPRRRGAGDDDDYVAERLDDPRASTACRCWAISNHLNGQAVCDDPIDDRHQAHPAGRGSGATATPRACASGPPRR